MIEITKDNINKRYARQKKRCKGFGWEYIGEGLYTKPGLFGWFDNKGHWQKHTD
jgi:hypothetical protein